MLTFREISESVDNFEGKVSAKIFAYKINF